MTYLTKKEQIELGKDISNARKAIIEICCSSPLLSEYVKDVLDDYNKQLAQYKDNEDKRKFLNKILSDKAKYNKRRTRNGSSLEELNKQFKKIYNSISDVIASIKANGNKHYNSYLIKARESLESLSMDIFSQVYKSTLERVINNDNEFQPHSLKDLINAYNKLEDEANKLLRAKKKLIETSSDLVEAIARNYLNRGIDFLDLIQYGNIGLLKALEKYSYEKDTKFTTYARWWIRQKIKRAIAEKSGLPVYRYEECQKVTAEHAKLSKELGRKVNSDELAGKLEKSIEKIDNLKEISSRQSSISLFKPWGSKTDNDALLIDFIVDQTALDPYQEAVHTTLTEKINQALSILPSREKQIIKMRYGLFPYHKEYTLQEIADVFDITRERVRQIVCTVLEGLRKPRNKNKKELLPLRELYEN
jgi:RNA polymerase primary sigma factor